MYQCRYISRALRDELSDTHSKGQPIEALRGLDSNPTPLSEKIDRFQSSLPSDFKFDNASNIASKLANDAEDMHAESEADESDDIDEEPPQDADAQVIAEFENFSKAVKVTPHYAWLMAQLHAESMLEQPTPDSRRMIRRVVSNALRLLHNPNITSMSCSARHRACFEIHWNLVGFLKSQGYDKPLGQCLPEVITLTSSGRSSQATFCREYMRETWPLVGEKVLDAIVSALKSPTSSISSSEFCASIVIRANFTTVVISNGMVLSVNVHEKDVVVTATGLDDDLAELAEQLAWLCCAVQSSPHPSKLACCQPLVKWCNSTESLPTTADVKFTISPYYEIIERDAVNNAGHCWYDLFRNPTIVEGFPVPHRSAIDKDVDGIEMPLMLMTVLAEATHASMINERLMIKGFSRLLLPVKDAKGALIWHLLFNTDGSYIRYTDPRIADVKSNINRSISPSDLDGLRHFVGWCSKVESHAGMFMRVVAI